MMQKNEGPMLDVWIKHHSKCAGCKNIFIFDNGSDDPETLEVLKTAERMGISVDYRFRKKSDFNSKGSIILKKIQELQMENVFEFFIPMDADELLAVETTNSLSFSRRLIEAELRKHINEERVIRIKYDVANNPVHEGLFRVSNEQRKCFFVRDTAASLDTGFHVATTKNGSDFVRTKICFVHFHFRNFAIKFERSREKLVGRLPSFSESDLLKHKEKQGAGWHLVDDLILGEEKYYAQHVSTEKLVAFSVVKKYLSSIGVYDKITELMDYSYLASNRSKNPSVTPDLSNYDMPPVQPTLALPAEVILFLEECYPKAKVIVEYGSGGSTVLAGDKPDTTVFSVESDRNWVAMMQRWFRHEPPKGTVHLQHVDIGPTKEWGYPQDTSRLLHYIDYPMSVWQRPDLGHPDVVLIDGRFRVACFVATLMHIRRPTTILFDDYTDRPHYHIVEELLAPAKTVGRMAVFEAKPRALHPSEWHRFGAYFFRPE